MRVKIISDGKPQNTKVVDLETGEQVKGVKAIEWRVDLNGLATCKLELIDVPIEAVAEVTELGDKWKKYELKRPVISCAHLQRIEITGIEDDHKRFKCNDCGAKIVGEAIQ